MSRPKPLGQLELPDWLRPIVAAAEVRTTLEAANAAAAPMTMDELRSPEAWAGKDPELIRSAVILHGGWAKVFPESEYKEFPLWASRVRNYFNARPQQLMRVDREEARRVQAEERIDRKSREGKGWLTERSLTTSVYKDETGRYWHLMTPGSTGYHYDHWYYDNEFAKSFLDQKEWKAVQAELTGQDDTPVFKLISPDGTGGSMEIIVRNPQHHEGKSQIGNVGEWVDLSTKMEINEINRGSYNYSESSLMGTDEHDFRDVDPHRAKYGFYVNPPSTASSGTPLPSEEKIQKIVASEHDFDPPEKDWSEIGGGIHVK